MSFGLFVFVSKDPKFSIIHQLSMSNKTSHLSISLFLSVSRHQLENVENICTLTRIYDDPAPNSC